MTNVQTLFDYDQPGASMIDDIDLSILAELTSQDSFPPRRLRRLRPEIVDAIAASMEQVGQLQPILITEDGTLIAGWHRIAAAQKLGWTSIKAIYVEGRSTNLMRLMEIDENLQRADLSPAEQSAHHEERQRLWEIEFPETRPVNERGGPGRGKTTEYSSAVSEPYTESAAKKLGIASRTVRKEIARAKAIPDVLRVAGTSLDKPEELEALSRLPEQPREELISRAMEGEKVTAKTTAKQIARDQKEQELAERTKAAALTLADPETLYNVIYIDPPWRWEPYSRETGLDRAADNHYPTEKLDGLKTLAVPAADDCVMFMWATAPMLPEALELMSHFGFNYKSCCVWVKDRIGTGYWFRNAHELLLVGTRGHIPAPAPGQQWESVIEADAGEHSKKPDIIAEMIEELFPNCPKLEMFSRSSRNGWDHWGNEAPQ